MRNGVTIPCSSAESNPRVILLDGRKYYTGYNNRLLDPAALNTAAVWRLGTCFYSSAELTSCVFNADTALFSGQNGDVNEDSMLSVSDALLLMRHLNGSAVALNESFADTNGDGRLNIYDAVKLLQILSENA